MSMPTKIVSSAEKGSSLGRDAWLRLKKNKLAMLSLWFFLTITILCFVLPLKIGNWKGFSFLPDPNQTYPELKSMTAFSTGTSAAGEKVFYLLGSDYLGRDIFSRMIYGGRISISVGLVATLVSLTIGVFYGAVSGFFGGRLDSVMMRIVDILYALPFIVLVIFMTTIFQGFEIFKGEKQLLLLFIAIGMVEWLTMARIVRSQVVSLKMLEFVEAARSLGLSNWRIITRHLIPNTITPVIVYTTLTVPAVMRLEAILSFLGLGVQPPNASWGSLIKEGADLMVTDQALLLYPSLIFGLTLFSLNFLGDGLRDALDPKSSKD